MTQESDSSYPNFFEQAPTWDDNPRPVQGNTQWGFYDSDLDFQEEAPKFAKWAARRMGYPIVEIEMIDQNFYAAFEEAINDYASIVNQYNIKENILYIRGISTDIDLTQKNVGGGLGQIIRLAKPYGTEAGSGGKIDWKKGYINVTASVQEYDLNELWAKPYENGSEIEIKRIFHQDAPITPGYYYYPYYPYMGAGLTYAELGLAGWDPVTTFVMYPIYEDLLRIQAVELNESVRKSAYSFELINNKLKLFPRPNHNYTVWFEYIVVKDRDSAYIQPPSGSEDVQSDFSNVNYGIIPYSKINEPGKEWIRKYALACAKETLGNIRGKYQSIPIPDSEVSLDGDTLRSEAQQEKETLITQLKEMLEEMSRQSRMEAAQAEAESLQEQLKKIPLKIYVG